MLLYVKKSLKRPIIHKVLQKVASRPFSHDTTTVETEMLYRWNMSERKENFGMVVGALVSSKEGLITIDPKIFSETIKDLRSYDSESDISSKSLEDGNREADRVLQHIIHVQQRRLEEAKQLAFNSIRREETLSRCLVNMCHVLRSLYRGPEDEAMLSKALSVTYDVINHVYDEQKKSAKRVTTLMEVAFATYHGARAGGFQSSGMQKLYTYFAKNKEIPIIDLMGLFAMAAAHQSPTPDKETFSRVLHHVNVRLQDKQWRSFLKHNDIDNFYGSALSALAAIPDPCFTGLILKDIRKNGMKVKNHASSSSSLRLGHQTCAGLVKLSFTQRTKDSGSSAANGGIVEKPGSAVTRLIRMVTNLHPIVSPRKVLLPALEHLLDGAEECILLDEDFPDDPLFQQEITNMSNISTHQDFLKRQLEILVKEWHRRKLPWGYKSRRVFVKLIKIMDFPAFALETFLGEVNIDHDALEYALNEWSDNFEACNLVFAKIVELNGGLPTTKALEWRVAGYLTGSNQGKEGYDMALNVYDNVIESCFVERVSAPMPIPSVDTFRLVAAAAVEKKDFQRAEAAYRDCTLALRAQAHTQQSSVADFIFDRAMWLIDFHEHRTADEILVLLDSHMVHAEEVLVAAAHIGETLPSQISEDAALINNMTKLQDLYNSCVKKILLIDWDRGMKYFSRMILLELVPDESLKHVINSGRRPRAVIS